MFVFVIAGCSICGGPASVGIDRSAYFACCRFASGSQCTVPPSFVIDTFGKSRVRIFLFFMHEFSRFLTAEVATAVPARFEPGDLNEWKKRLEIP